MNKYALNIKNRSFLRFVFGIYPRYKNYLINKYIIWIARRNGAQIGECVTIPYKLARNANSNLSIGSHTSIQTWLIDLRAKVDIGSNVIIGSGVEIITVSHDIDSVEWEAKPYGIKIEDFSWLATRVFVLPSCTRIGKGAVCAAGSVVVKNIDDMSVVSGNPAKYLRRRLCVHENLCIESLLGNDYLAYIAAYRRNEDK